MLVASRRFPLINYPFPLLCLSTLTFSVSLPPPLLAAVYTGCSSILLPPPPCHLPRLPRPNPTSNVSSTPRSEVLVTPDVVPSHLSSTIRCPTARIQRRHAHDSKPYKTPRAPFPLSPAAGFRPSRPVPQPPGPAPAFISPSRRVLP